MFVFFEKLGRSFEDPCETYRFMIRGLSVLEVSKSWGWLGKVTKIYLASIDS